MKRKIIFIMLNTFVSLSLLSPSYALSVADETNFSQDAQGTTSLLGEFDDETMTLTNTHKQLHPHKTMPAQVGIKITPPENDGISNQIVPIKQKGKRFRLL